ncbi:DNA/RNA non-specific endonuclease [Fructilactobacillus carniphilus]|uniref:DNA/RNA non-specific endonuclease n=1 Tax=Fructilactobacillus carniphilus TaxID=2940297 RepID=A0ABY5BXF7_9LACO|nr:DNA/RNA non-specific endonuclease [Fructilactobacillus carniphilus]USS90638.1 DNA/RNA non-specific endonuclease [Fructilactobacillus carniphilus]
MENNVINFYKDKFNEDPKGRPFGATAILTKHNLIEEGKKRHGSKFKPLGFENDYYKTSKGNIFVYNRGHIVPFKFLNNINDDGYEEKNTHGTWANRCNIFTQTQHSNQVIFRKIERKMLKLLENYDEESILYEARLQYNGNEIVPRGILINVTAMKSEETFQEYVPNFQPEISINYNNGKTYQI